MAEDVKPLLCQQLDPKTVFKGVKYYIVGKIKDSVLNVLQEGGAVRDYYLSDLIDYVIVSDATEPEYCEAKEIFELPVVSPRWVGCSLRCGRLLPSAVFSPDDNQVFSDVVVCCANLSKEDVITIWALITSRGGTFQMNLDNKVTHLITPKASGDRYNYAVSTGQIEIVGPDWVTACVRSQTRLSEPVYHPELILEDGEQLLDSSVLEQDEISTEDLERDEVLKAYRTKEELSRLVSSKIMASWKPAEEAVTLPPDLSPGRETLRNIGNSAVPSRGRGSRGGRGMARSPRGRSPKVSQLLAPAPVVTPQQFPVPYNHHMPPVPPVYYGHEPEEMVPADLCLLGCVFYINDYHSLYPTAAMSDWRLVIEQHGGEVDGSYNLRVTHVLCEHQRSDVCQLALRDSKRVVTAFWLNDVLVKGKMLPPWQGIHLPHAHTTEQPCSNQILCVTNFTGDSRVRLKHMITRIGAKYTGYLSSANSALITRKPEGDKHNKAIEWKLAIVNVHWLTDLWLGDLSALKLPVASRYLSYPDDPFKLEAAFAVRLLEAWRMPVRLGKEVWRKFSPSSALNNGVIKTEESSDELKRKTEELMAEDVTKKMKVHDDEQKTTVILMTGIPKAQAVVLAADVERLGGVVESVPTKACTHMICNNVMRTVKFLTALAQVQHIVTSDWLQASVQQGRFVSELPYRLVDSKAEELYQFSLADSLSRATRHKLFDGLVFYITPSVKPSRQVLERIIDINGGKTVSRRPSLRIIQQQEKPGSAVRYVVLSCEADELLYKDMTQYKLAVHSAELVLSGVLKQELDWTMYRINNLD